MNQRTCCFTGHRLQKLPFRFNEMDPQCLKLKKVLASEIERLITEEDISHFISGMAIGVDMFAAEAVLKLKRKHRGTTLEAAIPCDNQDAKWTEPLRIRYQKLLEKCDRTTQTEKHYTADCMHKRNRYMVDSSDYVIAVWDGSPSGTGVTVRYAMEKKRKLTVIHPVTMEVQYYNYGGSDAAL